MMVCVLCCLWYLQTKMGKHNFMLNGQQYEGSYATYTVSVKTVVTYCKYQETLVSKDVAHQLLRLYVQSFYMLNINSLQQLL